MTLEQFIDYYENPLNIEDTATLCMGINDYLNLSDKKLFLDLLKREGVDILKHIRGQYETVQELNGEPSLIELEMMLFDNFEFPLNIPKNNNSAKKFVHFLDSVKSRTQFNTVNGLEVDTSNMVGEITRIQLIPYLYRSELFIMLVVVDSENHTSEFLQPADPGILYIQPSIGYGLNTRRLQLTFERLQGFLNGFIKMYEEM